MAEPTAGSDDGAGRLYPVKPVEAELLVVTGMSGAGRSTASDALEDHGWYVVENLPPQMLGTLAELVSHDAAVHAQARRRRGRPQQGPLRRHPRRARRALQPPASPSACCSSTPATTSWCAASSRAAARTRSRAAAGSWTASPPNATCCGAEGLRRHRPGHVVTATSTASRPPSPNSSPRPGPWRCG